MQNTAKKSTNSVKNLVIAALLLAIGIIMPHFFMIFGTGMGTMFSPMAITVLLGAFILGGRYGIALGILTPLMSSFFTGMPPIFPVAIGMAVQYASMALIIGIFRNKLNKFLNLIIAQIIGNFVYAFVILLMLLTARNEFVFSGTLISVFVIGFPGIVLQWIVIPYLSKILKKAGVYNE